MPEGFLFYFETRTSVVSSGSQRFMGLSGCYLRGNFRMMILTAVKG